ncbi:UNVERIFIED_CONTAM: hypothetical protein Cloal_0793 [Acetivibrio alkalicellulosi]
MDMKSIYNGLKPLRRRIHLNNTIMCISYSFIAGGIVSLISSIVALFIPVTFLTKRVIMIYAVLLLCSFVVSIFLKPGMTKTIVLADSLGLKERLTTSFELKEDSTSMSVLQRKDTLEVLSNTDFKSLYPIKVPYNKIITGTILLIMTLFVFIIPTQAKERALIEQEVLNEAKAAIKMIEEEKKALNSDEKVSKERLEEINATIDNLLSQLKSAKNEEDALKALSKAKNELEELKKDSSDKLQRFNEKLMENQLFQDAAKAIDEGDNEKIEREFKELLEKIKESSKEELENLGQLFDEGAKELSEHKELAELLDELSHSLNSDDSDRIEMNLSQFKDMLANMSDGAGEEEALAQIAQSINNARQSISQKSSHPFSFSQANQENSSTLASNENLNNNINSQNQENNSNQNGNNGQQSSGSPEDNGQGGQDGQGQGSGEGQGSQSISISSQGSNGGGVGASIPKESEVRDYEEIFVPTRIGGESDPSQVIGTVNETGQSQWAEVNHPVLGGNVVPYNQVFGEYKEEAMSGIRDAPIPPGMKDIVRDYFSTLE